MLVVVTGSTRIVRSHENILMSSVETYCTPDWNMGTGPWDIWLPRLNMIIILASPRNFNQHGPLLVYMITNSKT
jgi:hypothetical protein